LGIPSQPVASGPRSASAAGAQRGWSRQVERHTAVADRIRSLDEFNAAVRCPDAHGGLACLPLLLEALAEDQARADGTRWIVDDNARLNMAALLRSCFPQPEIHVVAAEYGAAAHRRGWLHLDRALRTHDHTSLVETAESWAETDRTLDDVLHVYGRPSAIFGDRDPRSAKTLGYASGDRTAPLAVFHFGHPVRRCRRGRARKASALIISQLGGHLVHGVTEDGHRAVEYPR
jgi:hypothetical protein